jgi:hypothetical protein
MSDDELLNFTEYCMQDPLAEGADIDCAMWQVRAMNLLFWSPPCFGRLHAVVCLCDRWLWLVQWENHLQLCASVFLIFLCLPPSIFHHSLSCCSISNLL